MDYYENKEKVEKYIKFTPSHDGAILVDKLVELLPEGATVLELGVGPGKDFDRHHLRRFTIFSVKNFIR